MLGDSNIWVGGKRPSTTEDYFQKFCLQMGILALNSESLEMAFPYLVMHRWCWNLLRSVKDNCDPVLREVYTPAYMDKESELPWVVGYIFTAASGIDGVRDLRLLSLAVEACNDMISAGAGRVAIEIARKMGKDILFANDDEEAPGLQD
ncbi:hypothetical protein ACJZ2D_013365 [Fusarium nematophilum]